MMTTTVIPAKARLIVPSQRTSYNVHTFALDFQGENYTVTIWTNPKGRFVDYEVSTNDRVLDETNSEDDAEVIEAILEFVDKNFESLVNLPN